MIFDLNPVTDKDNFINNKDEINLLSENIKSHNSNFIFGRKGYGKTSLINQILNKKSNHKSRCIYINIENLEEFSLEYLIKYFFVEIVYAFNKELSIDNSKNELFNMGLKDFKSFESLNAYTIDFLDFQHNLKKPFYDILQDIFLFLDNISKKNDIVSYVFLDDFFTILDFKFNNKKIDLDKKFIYKIKNIASFSNLTLNLSSSNIYYYNIFFENNIIKNKFERIEIQPFTKQSISNFYKKNNLDINNSSIDKIIDLTNGNPLFFIFLSKIISKIDDKLTPEIVEKSYYLFISQEARFIFKDIFIKLTNIEKKILILISKGFHNRTIICNKGNIELQASSKYISYLEQKGLIHKTKKGEFDISDNMFKHFLSYYSENYSYL